MQGVGPFMNQLCRFLLYSNIHIPFLGFVLIISSVVYLDLEISFALVSVASAGAFLIYQIDRVWLLSPEDLVNQPNRVDWYQKHCLYKYTSTLLVSLIGGISLFYLEPATLWSGLLLGGIGFVYLLPFGSHVKRLKGHRIVKPVFIAFCWTYGVVILPVIEGEGRVDEMVLLFFIYRFLLIIANVLLADLPDRRGDLSANLTTLAVSLSEKRLIYTVSGFSIMAFTVGFVHGMIYQWPLLLFIDLGSTILITFLAHYSFQRNLSDSHLLLSYVNDLVIGWPIVSVMVYYLFVVIK